MSYYDDLGLPPSATQHADTPGAGAVVGAGIGAFTGQATALASAFALPAAVFSAVAFGRGTYRNDS